MAAETPCAEVATRLVEVVDQNPESDRKVEVHCLAQEAASNQVWLEQPLVATAEAAVLQSRIVTMVLILRPE